MRYSPGEKGEIQESWLIFKDHLLQAQEWSILIIKKQSKGVRRPAWMNMELLTELKHEKEAYKRQKQGQVTRQEYRAAVQACRKPKPTCS